MSRSPNEWVRKGTRYGRAGPSIIGMMGRLYEGGFINMKAGYYTEKKSRYTRIWPPPKLLECFPELPSTVVCEPVELVELRDEEGRLKEYRDTARTKRIRTILERANGVNEQADVRYWHYKLSGSLAAVFHRKFTLYGRLHTRGYRHYQGLSEGERAEIIINGELVVELDYSGLHPHLLYAQEGIQFEGDPYSIVDDRPEARPFLKEILLCLLNADDWTQDEWTANKWLHDNRAERQALRAFGIPSAVSVMHEFLQAHAPIAHYFCNGKETRLRTMNKDATIAPDIVNHFGKQGTPRLAVHDGFLVQERYRDELHRVMQEAYAKHTGGFNIPVK